MTQTLAVESINTIRTLAMDAVQKAKSGHPGAPMGLAPLAYALWTRVLQLRRRPTGLAGSGSLRPVRRAREHAALRRALPDGA